jgi:hypothetical protein
MPACYAKFLIGDQVIATNMHRPSQLRLTHTIVAPLERLSPSSLTVNLPSPEYGYQPDRDQHDLGQASVTIKLCGHWFALKRQPTVAKLTTDLADAGGADPKPSCACSQKTGTTIKPFENPGLNCLSFWNLERGRALPG